MRPFFIVQNNSVSVLIDAAIFSYQDHIRRPFGKQAIGDNTHDIINFFFHLDGVENIQIVNVQNDIAIIGDKALPVLRLPAQGHQFAGHVGARHGDDLHRQRKAA